MCSCVLTVIQKTSWPSRNELSPFGLRMCCLIARQINASTTRPVVDKTFAITQCKYVLHSLVCFFFLFSVSFSVHVGIYTIDWCRKQFSRPHISEFFGIFPIIPRYIVFPNIQADASSVLPSFDINFGDNPSEWNVIFSTSTSRKNKLQYIDILWFSSPFFSYGK